jgi:hypothetical protein
MPAGSATFSDRVVVGDPDAMDLERTLDGAPLDAVVVVQLLEHVRNPVRMLTTLGRHLSAEGCLVAAVPNIMHGSIRLGFLTGDCPAGLLTSDGASPSHWYDRAAMQRTCDRAGFVITRLERQTETFEPDRAVLDGTPLPTEIVASVMRDADAMTLRSSSLRTRSATGRFSRGARAGSGSRQAPATDTEAQRAEGQPGGELKRVVDGAVWKLDRIASDLQSVRRHGLQPS